jgi:hypothetical protein
MQLARPVHDLLAQRVSWRIESTAIDPSQFEAARIDSFWSSSL